MQSQAQQLPKKKCKCYSNPQLGKKRNVDEKARYGTCLPLNELTVPLQLSAVRAPHAAMSASNLEMMAAVMFRTPSNRVLANAFTRRAGDVGRGAAIGRM